MTFAVHAAEEYALKSCCYALSALLSALPVAKQQKLVAVGC